MVEACSRKEDFRDAVFVVVREPRSMRVPEG